MKNWVRIIHNWFFPKDIHHTIREYLEGELPPRERLFVEEQLQLSAEWKQTYHTMKAQIDQLQNMPQKTPPEQIWKNIAEQIRKEPQAASWTRWFDWNLYPCAPGYAIPALLIGLFFSWSAWNAALNEPNYHLISLEDGSAYSSEAESYIALHDLSGEPSVSRETLMALYTYDWNEQ